MNPKVKSVIFTLTGVALIGLAVFQISNKEIVQGKLTPVADTKLPDLKPTITVLPKDGENVMVEATVENIGEGIVRGDQEYNYSLYINDQLVFTNTDTYSEMGTGNKFSFKYPIDKALYNYPEKGFVSFVVDKDEKVAESNEENNETKSEY